MDQNNIILQLRNARAQIETMFYLDVAVLGAINKNTFHISYIKYSISQKCL